MFKTFTALAIALPLSWTMASTAAAQKPAEEALDPAAAKAHFGKAKEFYLAGNYKAAKTELEEAQRLDPNAKELVLNLANVCEKLASYDEALKWFTFYKGLPSVTPEEQTKADASLRRIEGAKRASDEEAAKRKAEEDARHQAELDKSKTVVVVEKPVLRKSGRVDALTLGAAGIGVVGLGVGTIFGLKALNDDPSGVKLTSSFTYNDYVARHDKATQSATISTIGFGVGLAATVGAAILYFARPAHDANGDEPPPAKAGDVNVGFGSLSVRFQ